MSVDCSLKACKTNRIHQVEGRVEVRAVKPPVSRTGFLVDWGSEGQAVFHWTCWEEICCSHKRNSKLFSDIEKEMISVAAKTAEFHDADDVIEREAKRIADLIKKSQYCIAFTGAGISTAAGIGDFRGKEGKWTEREKVKNYGARGASKRKSGYSLHELRPTSTHEALAKFVEMGLVKHVISQNTDGLHRLSGIPAAKLSELHGNAFVEKCETCEQRVELSRRLPGSTAVPPKPCSRCSINHRTGRRCNKKACGGYMMNTIINFGDFLESDVLHTAEVNAKKADMVLCLGTTLRVSPANSLVMMGNEPLRIVLCNRQKTDFDEVCLQTDPLTQTQLGSRVYGDCDRLMQCVIEEILPQEKLEEWQSAKGQRMVEYDTRRQ